MRIQRNLRELIVALGVLSLLASGLMAQVKPNAPVIEEEEPAQPVKPAKAGAPVVEEEEAPKPAAIKPGSPVIEEEAPEPVKEKPAAPAPAPVSEESSSSAEAADSLLRAPSIVSIPKLDLRLFADTGYSFAREKGEQSSNGFRIGAFDMFASSKLSDRVSVIAEILFELNSNNEYVFDLERMTLRYRQNKYFNFEMGRFHSSVSYYNSTYHHGRWFETTAERPFIAEWEDDGGILPSHGVGLRVSGAMPSPEALPVSYFFEVTNGRGFINNKNEVQAGNDSDPKKAVNLGFTLKPARVPGLQLGSAVYSDKLRPALGEEWRERIFSFHAVYQRGRVQWLNEAVHLRHQGIGAVGVPAASFASTGSVAGRRSSISGMYSQFGYRIGKIVPFTRVDWLNAPGSNPVARAAFGAETGLRKEVATGFFYDLSAFSALKFQVDRAFKSGVSQTEVIVQLAFAF